jgi:hypothetical protein
MRAAKIQKATLDPLKISGRCGRLMCCLRYEDATYEDLRKRLPKNKTRVGTAEGPGIVVDSKILVQLVLVRLDPPPGAMPGEFGREIAVPVEELMDPDKCPAAGSVQAPDGLRGMSTRSIKEKLAAERGAKLAKQDRYREKSEAKEGGAAREGRGAAPKSGAAPAAADADAGAASAAEGEAPAKKKKRRRKKKKPGVGTDAAPGPGSVPPASIDARGSAAADDADGDDDDGADDDAPETGGATQPSSGEGPAKKKRRRRRRRGNRPGSEGGAPGGSPGDAAPPA